MSQERVGKIVNLSVVPAFNPEPCAFTVDLLKDLLARAEAGDIRGVALVSFNLGGVIQGSFSPEMLDDCYACIGALEALKFQIIDEVSHDEYEDD